MRLSKSAHSLLPLIAGLLLFSCAGQPPAGSLPSRVALTYGAADFGRVEALRYQFNVKLGEKEIRRSWQWHPRSDQVVFYGSAEQGGTLRYERGQLAHSPSEALKKVDAWFINDQYWLLFPLHLLWDRTATISANSGRYPLPIGGGSARRLVVKYPSTGGYTPGDIYELFIASDTRILQWIYRRGGSPQPTRVSTWEDHQRFGPLLIAMDHRGPDDTFRVWFSEVSVKLQGQTRWLSGKSD
jgi:hypothetical protein